MKIKGTVTETIVVEKVVEIEMPDTEDREKIEDFVCSKAYESTIFSDSPVHGWEGVDTVEVEVKWEKIE